MTSLQRVSQFPQQLRTVCVWLVNASFHRETVSATSFAGPAFWRAFNFVSAPLKVGSIGFSVHMREFSNQGAATLLDFCNGTASGSSLTSTGGSGFEPFLCTVMMEIEGTDHGDNADATCNFLKVLLTCDFSEGDPNVLNVQGEVYGGIQRGGQT